MQTISDDIDFLQFLGKQESQYIIKPSQITDKLLARLRGDETTRGELLPWSKTHNIIALRPGEVSVWGGYNGHGKSQLLGQVCAWNLQKKWLIASMEMTPAATMLRMIRQVCGTNQPSEGYATGFLKWTDDKLWIYDQLDSVKQDRIIGMVHYAAQVLGINHIVIDSLMKCGIATDDLNMQKQFVDKLCWAAKSENIHIHLIHHMRKGHDEFTSPGKHDFRGAGEITDLVDNVFIIHRNKQKEMKVELDQPVSEAEPDCLVTVAKQRHGEWEGRINLWFHPASLQYTSSSDRKTLFYKEEWLR